MRIHSPSAAFPPIALSGVAALLASLLAACGAPSSEPPRACSLVPRHAVEAVLPAPRPALHVVADESPGFRSAATAGAG